ncbi:hypothetical protein [Streptomyces sp. WMMC1477]|uniref:hypothetical protein n=1 Tax=Streptomyces sp. WMMC1477 TaxID=3015155 RepID=UPI0022B6F220|nr:hypothetical protein [Streptomyces sp. WMMC1477]MCZ7432281.1 hypothetical protein [Streptomyces sp. WMMC1477]
MEHEVYVPFPVGPVRAALAEAERVARCVPGLQLDAEEGRDADGTVTGRLRVRIGGSTITYRGSLEVTAQDDGFRVVGKGDEARGQGSARLTLTLAPRPAEGRGEPGDEDTGTVLLCSGTVRGKGRLTEAEPVQRAALGRRLLERFGQALAESLAADPPADDNERVIPGIPAPDQPAGARDEPQAAAPAEPEEEEQPEQPGPEAPEPERPSVFDTEVPPPSLDPLSDEGYGGHEDREGAEPVPAEAAHARRTMIGRSAEEVDHAPPRGRYAPVPAPETFSTQAALRWAAPAAALVVASAVLVGRALRRRR